jgi:hypothetical protein
MFQQLLDSREIENALVVRNDAANRVLSGVLPYCRKQLRGAVTSSPSGETRRVHSESLLSCNLRGAKINFDVARKRGRGVLLRVNVRRVAILAILHQNSQVGIRHGVEVDAVRLHDSFNFPKLRPQICVWCKTKLIKQPV